MARRKSGGSKGWVSWWLRIMLAASAAPWGFDTMISRGLVLSMSEGRGQAYLAESHNGIKRSLFVHDFVHEVHGILNVLGGWVDVVA
jgi:hypothetical protein